MWTEYLFCFGEMSFCLFKFRNIGKFVDNLVDNALKIEKVSFVVLLKYREVGGVIRKIFAFFKFM